MKLIRCRFPAIICALLIVMLLPLLAVRAASTVSLQGTQNIRAGDTVTLTFRVSGTGLLGVSCNLSYNENHLSFQKMEQLIDSPWVVASQSGSILAYDDAHTAPINEETALFSVTFKVKGSVEPGTPIEVALQNIVVSSGEQDETLNDAVYQATVLAPRASDATLSKLSASNAELSPAFDPSITEYEAQVPYSVRSIDFSVKTSHAAATYKISGNTLSVGRNRIRVKVTAEDGSTRTYNVYVTREQDPNYVPSSDATLKSLSLSDGQLSPSFQSDILKYVVYLPYEVSSLTLTGQPNDSKGSAPEVKADLLEGLNVLVFVGIAEDESRLEYVIHAVRMPPFGETADPILPPPVTDPPPATDPIDTPPPPDTDPIDSDTLPPTVTTGPSETPPPETEPVKQPTGCHTVSAITIILVGLVSICIGFTSAILLNRRSYDSEDES